MRGFLGHGGWILGYTSMMMYHPKEEVTIIVLLNKYDREIDYAQELFVELAEVIIPDQFQRPLYSSTLQKSEDFSVKASRVKLSSFTANP